MKSEIDHKLEWDIDSNGLYAHLYDGNTRVGELTIIQTEYGKGSTSWEAGFIPLAQHQSKVTDKQYIKIGSSPFLITAMDICEQFRLNKISEAIETA